MFFEKIRNQRNQHSNELQQQFSDDIFKKVNLNDLKEINITKSDLRRLRRKRDQIKGGLKDIKFTVYKTSVYAKLANSFFENLTFYLSKRFSFIFLYLNNNLRSAGISILSKTYMSVAIFSSFIAFFGTLTIAFMISLFLSSNILLTVLRSIGLAFLAFITTFFIIYFYPNFIISGRRRAIKNDLPFVIIHMAAVAGSGAQPISLFNLVLNTGEYKGLEKEIKKIINYVNLFGYELTSALRSVASTTPSPQFRELLTGIVATLETGGGLKEYLKSKADDALTTYKLEREKYVESISTYSDIYTSVLIAAPLLFLITIAIINMIGGKIGPFESRDIAFFGTFVFLPFLNIVYIIFLNIIQPGE